MSDRWHLVKNLAECVSVQVAESLAELRRAEQGRTRSETKEKRQPAEEHHPTQTRAVQHAQQTRQAERTARYEQIMDFQKEGMKQAEIAFRLGVTQRTIQRWVATGAIPYSGPRKQRVRLIDPYKTYLLKRWHQGCRKGSQLEREVRAKGYEGSQHGVYRYLKTLKASAAPSQHKSGSKRASRVLPNPLLALSAHQATWLFFRKEEELKTEEQETLQHLRQASAPLETTYQLVKTFLYMVRELAGEQLDAWLEAVQASQLEAFQTFVAGVQKDKDAVLAGLTLPWNNGPLEGHVNRLKLIKRSMYGRAELDLLKRRVLHRSKRNQERKDKYKHHQGQQENRFLKNDTNSQHTIAGISRVA